MKRDDGIKIFDEQLLRSGLTDEQERAMFSKHVASVVIELTSLCNRKCSFCPTKMRKDDVRMDTALLKDIVAQLAEIDYKADVCLQWFNEPLMDKEMLYKGLSLVRARLPEAMISFSTNGDFLDREALRELSERGLTHMTISVHPVGPYDDVTQLNQFSDLTERTGLKMTYKKMVPGRTIIASSSYENIEIMLRATNFDEVGVDRCGLVKHIPKRHLRHSPCRRPTMAFNIAYDGSVYACCNFVAGIEEHAEYVVGSVSEEHSIFNLYASADMVKWRRMLFAHDEKQAPCATCTLATQILSDEEKTARAEFLQSVLSSAS